MGNRTCHPKDALGIWIILAVYFEERTDIGRALKTKVEGPFMKRHLHV